LGPGSSGGPFACKKNNDQDDKRDRILPDPSSVVCRPVFSNTIEAIIHGANYLDSTVYGIGRAAGNCPLELLIGFLNNPKFEHTPHPGPDI
jgi:hypothetical protein